MNRATSERETPKRAWSDDEWEAAIEEFARTPSVEAWGRLVTSLPEDDLYDRTRTAMQIAMRLGVDGDLLFRCSLRYGITPDTIELIERGQVDPETVAGRGRERGHVRGLWLGLAAQSAKARGDRVRTVEYLREAYASADALDSAPHSAARIREEADDELHELLDRAGIPRDPLDADESRAD